MNRHLLKSKEVAERLNISRSQAFALMRSGEIQTVRFGDRCVRVRPEDLEEFIEKSSVGPTKNLLAALTASKSEQVTPRSIGDHHE